MVPPARILVADDEPEWRDRCKRFLEREGYEVSLAAGGREAAELFARDQHDVVLTDLDMPDGDGMSVLKSARERDPDAIVLIFTGYGTIQDAVAAMREGAYDFITKPFSPEQLRLSVERSLEPKRLRRENRALQDQLEQKFNFDNIVGKSSAMQAVFSMISRVAKTDANVLITGASGTGKELVARSLHANSRRKNQDFVALNCGGLPEQLVESELFGHEKGAFTGATGLREGLMEHANGGTFFLDEIGELPKELQVKFLRVLEERTIRRVGSNREREVDIRLISATNQSLEEMIEEGRFREDLFYRINTFDIRLPSLIERIGDVPLLCSHFLKIHSEKHGRDVRGFSSSAMALLEQYSWPGNVRELMNVIERACALTASEEIQVEDLPESLTKPPRHASHSDIPIHLPFKDAKELMVADFEKNYITRLLEEYRGHVTRVSEKIGIDRRSLHRILERHGINAASYKRRAD